MGIILFVLSVVVFLAILNAYLGHRIYKVYEVRSYFIDKHYELYGKLPSYEEMLYHPKHYLKWSAEDWVKYVEQLDKGE